MLSGLVQIQAHGTHELATDEAERRKVRCDGECRGDRKILLCTHNKELSVCAKKQKSLKKLCCVDVEPFAVITDLAVRRAVGIC